MQAAQLRARLTNALKELASDAGRYLLFMLILSVAFLASFILAAIVYGALLVSGTSQSLVVAFKTGSQSAGQILTAFTEPELTFYFLSVLTALFMGAATYWSYHKTIASLGRLRRWMRTTAVHRELRGG